MSRQQRKEHKKRQKWFWGSVGLAVTLGATAIVWSYLPSSQPQASVDSNSTASDQSQDEDISFQKPNKALTILLEGKKGCISSLLVMGHDRYNLHLLLFVCKNVGWAISVQDWLHSNHRKSLHRWFMVEQIIQGMWIWLVIHAHRPHSRGVDFVNRSFVLRIPFFGFQTKREEISIAFSVLCT